MTKDEALKLALGKIRAAQQCHPNAVMTLLCEADEIIEEALAQPEQEPVAWMYEVNGAHTILDLFEPPDDAYDEGTLHPLYTTPPQRKPLSDEEIGTIAKEHINVGTRSFEEFARRIEAAHNIKENT